MWSSSTTSAHILLTAWLIAQLACTCAQADLEYDVYHASVDVEGDRVEQQYYIRTRFGDSHWNGQKAGRLK